MCTPHPVLYTRAQTPPTEDGGGTQAAHQTPLVTTATTNNNKTRQKRVSPPSAATRRNKRQTGNAAPTGHTFLRTTSPLSYTATVYRAASQLLKKEGTTPRPMTTEYI
ncbi:hypothetical protein E2C01_071751 [Portunus trituberculatus]|uniref:Uncharacterized protein n=1 Tax=Portunus trituberculatus TaxID=210409 RepID=A0A5B7HXU3_PORTR|nr:hypothetical protein [Portunus trituberculatus]